MWNNWFYRGEKRLFVAVCDALVRKLLQNIEDSSYYWPELFFFFYHSKAATISLYEYVQWQ